MKNFVFLVLLFFSSLYGQNEIIRMTALQDFYIPDSIAIIFHNVYQVNSFKINLTKKDNDGNYQPITNNLEYISNPLNNRQLARITKENRGHSPSITYKIKNTINEPGEYQLELILNSMQKRTRSNPRKTKKFDVIVEHPVLSSAIELRGEYYLSENASASFSMSGLSDKDAYSYSIVETGTDNIVKEDTGPIVDIDSNVVNIENVDKTFDIIIRYKNKIFDFKTRSGTIISSKIERKFTVRTPKLEIETIWGKENNNYQPIVFENKNAVTFYILCKGKKFNNSQIYINPEVNNISISDNNGYVSKSFDGGYDQIGFRIILTQTQKYKELEKRNIYRDVLTLKFSTKFHGARTEKFYAIFVR